MKGDAGRVIPLVVLLAAALGACSSEVAARREEFRAACPEPEWWDRVSVEGIEIRTYGELLDRWRDDERSDSQFFKAAYQAILDYPADTALVVTALGLLPYVQGDYRHMTGCLEYAVDHHFDWNRPMGNYAGKPGDTVAGIVRQLARRYNADGRHHAAITLIERLLEERAREVNDQLLQLLALTHAEALARSGQMDQAAAVLERAIQDYDGDWDDRLRERLERYEQGRI